MNLDFLQAFQIMQLLKFYLVNCRQYVIIFFSMVYPNGIEAVVI